MKNRKVFKLKGTRNNRDVKIMKKRNLKQYILPVILTSLILIIGGVIATTYMTEDYVRTPSLNSSSLNITSLTHGILIKDNASKMGSGKELFGMSILNSIDDRDNLHIATNTSTGGVGIYLDNYGTQDAMAVFQHSVLSATEYTLKIINLANQTNSELVRISNAQGDTTQSLLRLVNVVGNNHVFKIENGGTKNAIYIVQENNLSNVAGAAAIGVYNDLNSGRGLDIYSNMNADVLYSLARFYSDNTAFDEPTVEIRQDGTGEGIYLTGGSQTSGSSGLVFINTGSGSSSPGIRLNSEGSGNGIYMVGTGAGDMLRINQDSTGGGILLDDMSSNKSIMFATNDKVCMDGSTCSHYLKYNGTCIMNGTTCIA